MPDTTTPKVAENLEQAKQSWKKRVLEEQEDLKRKCESLHNFIQSASFDGVDSHEQGLLKQQLNYMQAYRRVLNDRIKHNQEN